MGPSDALGTNDGLLYGSMAFGPGKVGQAFSFTNSSAYVEIPASSSLNVGGNGTGLTRSSAGSQPNDVSNIHPQVEFNNGSAWAGLHFWIYGFPQSLMLNVIDTGASNHFIVGPGLYFDDHRVPARRGHL